MRRHVLAATLACCGLMTGSALAASHGGAGAHGEGEHPMMVGGDTMVLDATVEAVDVEKRQVTLKGADGEVRTVTVDDEVRNLAQVRVGDQVRVEFFQAVALELRPTTSGIRMRREVVGVERAPMGAKPAGSITRTVEFVGTVQALDLETRMVTLRGVEKIIVLKADEDVDLSGVEVGGNVEGVYVESFAVAVTSN